MMRKFLYAACTVIALAACNPHGPDDPVQVLCKTQAAVAVTERSALLEGTSIITSAQDSAEARFFMRAGVSAPAGIDSLLVGCDTLSCGRIAPDGEDFHAAAEGLKPATTYWFVAAVTSGMKTGYGKILSFTTKTVRPPLVETLPAAPTCISAVFRGRLNASADTLAKASAGFEYSLSDLTGPDSENADRVYPVTIASDGSFTTQFSPLLPDTRYCLRAFVAMGGRYFYADTVWVCTQSLGLELETMDADPVMSYSSTLRAKLKINNPDSLAVRGGFYCSSNATTFEGLKATGKSVSAIFDEDGGMSADVTGLASNTEYFFVPWVEVDGKETPGEVRSFFTRSVDLRLFAMPATNVGPVSAQMNAVLTEIGDVETDGPVLFYYSTSVSDPVSLRVQGREVAARPIVGDSASYSAQVDDLTNGTQYWYVAYTVVDGREFFSNVEPFTTVTPSCPTGAVNLGLSVCWATCNIGAASPSQSGSYFAWGETSTYYDETKAASGFIEWVKSDGYYWKSYIWQGGSSSVFTKYCFEDSKVFLDPEDDVATVRLGSDWRMPTFREITELVDNCTISEYGPSPLVPLRTGIKFTSKKPGFTDKSIIIPCSGIYSMTNLQHSGASAYVWSAERCTGDSDASVWHLRADNSRATAGHSTRFYGMPVRPVADNKNK